MIYWVLAFFFMKCPVWERSTYSISDNQSLFQALLVMDRESLWNPKRNSYWKTKFSTAVSTFLIRVILCTGSSYQHVGYFQKSKLFSNNKIYTFWEESIFIWLNTFCYDYWLFKLITLPYSFTCVDENIIPC